MKKILIINISSILIYNTTAYSKQLIHLFHIFNEMSFEINYLNKYQTSFISDIIEKEKNTKKYDYDLLKDIYNTKNIQIYQDDIYKKINYFFMKLDDNNRIDNNGLNEIIEDNKIDLLFYFGDLCCFSNENLKIPSYCIFHNHYYPLSKQDIKGISCFTNIISLSPSIKLILEKKFPDKKIYYLPHIVNNIHNVKETKNELRIKWNLPMNKYIVLINSQISGFHNENRKSIDTIFIAFKNFNEKYPDSILILNNTCNIDEKDNIILNHLIDVLKIQNNIIVNNIPLPEISLNELYILSDVLLCCSKGEGFGIPIIEAQTNHLSVITNNFLSMKEHNFQNNIVNISCESYDSIYQGIWKIPSSCNIEKKLEEIYLENANKLKQKNKRANWISRELTSYNNIKKNIYKIFN